MAVIDMSRQTGATEYSISRAIEALNLSDTGKRDITDRRRIIYPPGTLEKVRKWLETN
jgi:hypothetical protein